MIKKCILMLFLCGLFFTACGKTSPKEQLAEDYEKNVVEVLEQADTQEEAEVVTVEEPANPPGVEEIVYSGSEGTITKTTINLIETLNLTKDFRSFRMIYDFSDGLALIEGGERLFYINTQGESPFDISGYKDIGPFSEGLAPVSAMDENTGTTKWGYINTNGEKVIPFIYDEVRLFSEGLAAVREGDLCSFIDKTGSKKFSLLNENFPGNGVETIEAVGDFHDGVVCVKGVLSIPAEDEWGEGVNEEEKVAIRRAAGIGDDGHYDKELDALTFFDKNGTALFYTERKGLGICDFSNGICVVGLGYYYDKSGNLIMGDPMIDKYHNKFGYGATYNFTADGLARVSVETGYGFIDKSGNYVIESQYHYAEDFSEGLAAVSTEEGRVGYIDTKGELVIPFKFSVPSHTIGYRDELYSFSDGLAFETTPEGAAVIINKTGDVLADVSGDVRANSVDTDLKFHDNLFSVFSDGYEGKLAIYTYTK